MPTPGDCQGRATASRDTPIGWQLAGRAQSRPVIPRLSVIFTLFQHNHPEQPRVIALGMMKWAAWLYSAVGSCLTIIWHVALFGFLADMHHRAPRCFMLYVWERVSIWAEAADRKTPWLIIITVLQCVVIFEIIVDLWPFFSPLGMVLKRQPGNWECSLMESPMTRPAAHPIRCWYVSVVTQRRVDCFVSAIKVFK